MGIQGAWEVGTTLPSLAWGSGVWLEGASFPGSAARWDIQGATPRNPEPFSLPLGLSSPSQVLSSPPSFPPRPSVHGCAPCFSSCFSGRDDTPCRFFTLFQGAP